jgi:hypothetical protein
MNEIIWQRAIYKTLAPIMKNLRFIFILLLTGTIRADYEPPTFHELILKADKIVYGEIVCIDKRVIELKVHESINHEGEKITIGRFVEWQCGKRWTDYVVGQTSMFFLRKRDGDYLPFGGSNEGEMPIHDDKVFVQTTTISMIDDNPPFERSTLTIEDLGYNNPYKGFVLDLSNLWQATRIIKNCFTSGVTATGNLVNIQQLCSPKEYKSVMEKNKILKWAITEIKS